MDEERTLSDYIYSYYIDRDEKISELLVSYTSLIATRPKYPIAVMTGKYVSERAIAFLRSLDILILDASFSDYSEIIYDEDGNVASYCNCSGKLALYNFQQFKKIVYIDTDTYITKNVDELFDLPDGSMARYCWDERQISNGGVIVLEPNQKVVNMYQNYFAKSREEGRFEIPDDQELLWTYYKYNDRPELHLCYIYNVVASDLDRYKQSHLFDIGAVKIYHFVGTCYGKKVWDIPNIYLYNMDTQELIINYLKQWNLIITMYKKLYPDLEFLRLAEYAV